MFEDFIRYGHFQIYDSKITDNNCAIKPETALFVNILSL